MMDDKKGVRRQKSRQEEYEMARRGENIYKRGDGRWEGRYTAGYDQETGKRIIKNVLGKTQAGDTVKTELIYDREKVRAESCPDFSYISQKLR